MALIATSKGGSSRPLTPAGTHIARCVRLIDLGTQHDEFQGKPKILQKIRIGWELPYERAIFSEEKGEQAFLIDKEYTLSLGEKANLRHDLEGWRGRAFTEEELAGFDLTTIVGKACMITVVHKKSADGTKTYDRVTSVSSVPKDPATKKTMACPPQENPTVIYDIADGQNNVFDELPAWIQDKIKDSDEFKNMTGGGDKGSPVNESEDEDDIPF